MYLGNMKDFVEKLSEYTQKEFGLPVEFCYYDYPPGNVFGGYWLFIRATDHPHSIGYKVHDCKLFEEECYDIIRHRFYGEERSDVNRSWSEAVIRFY